MICQKCGENLPDNARECFTCGAKVRREVMVEPVVEVAPEPEIAVIKPPRPSGEVLKEVFSSGSYLIVCILLTLRAIMSIGVNVFAPHIEKVLDEELSIDFTNSIINIAVQLLLIVPVWMVYFCSRKMENPLGTDFTKMFKVLYIYAIISLVAAIIDAVISLVAMAAISLFSISGVISVIVSLVLTMLPNYAAFQLTKSLVDSSEKGRMLLEGVIVLRVYCIISSIIFIALLVIMVLGAIIVDSLFFIFALVVLIFVLLALRTHNFLYLLQDKSKYEK